MDKDEQITDSEPRIYEVGYLLVPTLDDAGALGVTASIKDFLAKANASIIADDSPKMRNLAYTVEEVFESKIRKFNSAYFGWIKFESDPSVSELLSADLKKNQAVIRFLLIKTVRENTMFQPRAFHPGRVAEGAEVKRARTGVVDPNLPKMTTEEMDKTIEELVVE